MIEEPTICAGCGLVQVQEASGCPACETVYGDLRARDQPGDGFWVGVRAYFTCNACRFDSPLNHFELEEGVVCARCGLEQKYEGQHWRAMGELAHQVGDFGSGGPQGRFPDDELEIDNPFGYLGDSELWAKRKYFQAAPGNPLCRSCQAPMVFVRRQGDQSEVKCSGCGEARTYEFPDPAKRIKYLIAVVADEHEAGRSEAVLREENGVVALMCPGCGAPLENVGEGDGIIVCGYCQASCRISNHAHARAGHKDTPAKTWWLYFDQPSPERKKRLNQARQQKARADKKQNKAEHRQRSMAGQPASKPKKKPVDPQAAAKKAEKRALMPLLLVFLATPFIALAVLKPWKKSPIEIAAEAEASADQALAGGLKTFRFGPPEEMAAHFGASGDSRLNVEGDRNGQFARVEVNWSDGPTPVYSLRVHFGSAFDDDALERRLREVVPDLGPRKKIGANKTTMSLSATNLSIQTWIRDKPEAQRRANAMLAIARYGLFEGEQPDASVLRLVRGQSLAAAGEIDVSVPVERAAAAVQKVFPTAGCDTVTDMMTKQTGLRCKVQVDHPFIRDVYFGWPNEAKGKIRYVQIVIDGTKKLKSLQDPASACLTPLLGAGETVVTDHAKGTGHLRFELGPAGDHVRVDPAVVRIGGDPERAADAPATWTQRLPAIAKALSDCEP